MDRKAQFRQWLFKTGRPGAATNYPNSVVRVSEHYSEQMGKKISIYDDISDQEEISRIAGLYKQGGKFSEFGYKHNRQYQNAIARYSEFFADELSENNGENSDEGRPANTAAEFTAETLPGITAPQKADAISANFGFERDLQTVFCAQISALFSGYKIVGREYQIRGKRIDVLLEHADNKDFLVVELKAGKADAAVFGQISMYIGMLRQQPGLADRKIQGVIIANAIDDGLLYACKTSPDISVKTYRMNLELEDSDLPEIEENDV